MDKSELQEMIIELHADVKALKDRTDKHSFENKTALKELKEVVYKFRDQQVQDREDILDRIHENKIDSLDMHHKLGLKVAGLSGGVSLVVAAVMTWIKMKFFGGEK